MAILDAQSTLLQSFAWGTDLSGTLTGAGGVGGLLSMTDYQQGTAGTYFYAYDGNGNVAGLVNAADGKVAAAYEYGPFGEVIRASGPLAQVNPFRFSTKYQDEETGFLYYGYRYYNPSTGRWPNRDPTAEKGGQNLFGFLSNDPVGHVDYLGQGCAGKCGDDITEPLKTTLQTIKEAFDKIDEGSKKAGCREIIGLGPEGRAGAEKAWDIKQVGLLTLGGEYPGYYGGEGYGCKYTAAFEGKCYHTDAINYVMWGLMNSLCWEKYSNPLHSQDFVVPLLVARKQEVYHQSPGNSHVDQAVAFTRYGFGSTQALRATALRNCHVTKGEACHLKVFDWKWEPWHHGW